MAFRLAELYVDITTRDEAFRRRMTHVSDRLKAVSRSMQGVARAARRMLLVTGAAMALTIKAASDAEEVHSKFLAVFKEEADAATAWGNAHAKAVGRSRMDMEKYLSSIQDTFVPLGFARDKARELSQQVVQLGIDIASFNNAADDTALRDLQSAIVGNHETVRKYGIIITEATLKQEMLRMGIKKSYHEVSNQEKVQGRLNIIMRNSTDAQGDATRTSGSFANQLKRLRGEITDASAAIGRVFVPALSEMIAKLVPLTASIGRFAEANKGLALSFAKVGAAMLVLLTILPGLHDGLAMIAAHPAIAVLLVFTAVIASRIAKILIDMAVIGEKLQTATGISPTWTKANLEVRLEGLKKRAEEARIEIEKLEKSPAMVIQVEGRLDVTHGGIIGRALHLEKLKEARAGIVADLNATADALNEMEKREIAVADAAKKRGDAEADAAEKTLKALEELNERSARISKMNVGQIMLDAEIKRLAKLKVLPGAVAPKQPKAAGFGGPAMMSFQGLAQQIQQAIFAKENERALKDNTKALRDSTVTAALLEATIKASTSGGLMQALGY